MQRAPPLHRRRRRRTLPTAEHLPQLGVLRPPRCDPATPTGHTGPRSPALPCVRVVVVPFGTGRSGSRTRRDMLFLAEPCFVPVAHVHPAASWTCPVKCEKRRACGRPLTRSDHTRDTGWAIEPATQHADGSRELPWGQEGIHREVLRSVQEQDGPQDDRSWRSKPPLSRRGNSNG